MEIIDNIYIQPCTNEIQGFGISPENQEGRLKDGHSRKVSCSSKDVNDKNVQECSYENKLIYEPYRFPEKSCDNVTVGMFWEDLALNIVNLIGDKEVKEDKVHNTFLIVSHHNRMKKNILIINKNNKNHINAYSNASSICVNSYENGISIITDGYPDRDSDKYIYANAENIEDDILTTETQEALNKFRGKLKDKYVTVIIIRHGNALHNYPVNARNILHQGPLDSSLTPLGCLQATITGFYLSNWIDTYSKSNNFPKSKIWLMTSYLNRAQHTAALIGKILATKHNIKVPNIDWLENKFNDEAYDKFLRNSNLQSQKLLWAQYNLLLAEFENSEHIHLSFKSWNTDHK